MFTTEQFTKLEQEERELTDEAILAILVLIMSIKGDLEKELRDFYHRYGKDGVVTYAEARKWVSQQDHRRRFTALTIYLNDAFHNSLSDITDKFESMLKEVVKKETDFFDEEIDEEALLEMIWGVDESNWLTRLEDDVELWIAYIASDWVRSLLQRKHIDDVLKQLNKRFNTIESVITSLGITESTAIGSLARQRIFKQLGIAKYQFYSRPDERRCETCGALHGRIFPMSAYEVGVTASPIHPRCRCWEVPIWD